MNNRDFYPAANGAYSKPFNMSSFKTHESGYESNYDQGEDGDEDMTDWEAEDDASGVNSADLPTYKDLVKMKKLGMKAQYGKGHFGSKRECKTISVPSTCYKQVCLGKNCKDVPYPCMKNKEQCIMVPAWIPGWRRKWREFKQQGGLAQLKLQSVGLPIPGSTPDPSSSPTPQEPQGSGLTCEQLAAKYGIIGGKTFGTANDAIKQEWMTRKCTSAPGTQFVPGEAPSEGGRLAVVTDLFKNKGTMILAIAIILIIIIAVVMYMKRRAKS